MEPKRLHHELKIRGISQKELAARIGVSPQAISAVVCGTKNICRIRQAIADALGLPVDAVFAFNNNQKKTENNPKTQETDARTP